MIERWEPGVCKIEKNYEKSLYNFLHNELEEIQVTKQYARGRIKADLVIGDKVIIEIKNNLNTTGKYQRLIGQIAEYREWEGSILIILVGETDQNLNKQLKKFLNKEGLFEEEKVTLIEK